MAKTYTVKQGDCLSSLAKSFGFVDYKTIYDHPQNTELKKERYNPNVLNPGDKIFIPDHDLKEVDKATEQRHNFVLNRDKTLFRIAIIDDSEGPLANLRYELKVDSLTFEGTTDAEGRLEQEIPADAKHGVVTVFSNGNNSDIAALVPVGFGHLDPVEEITGIQSRLRNLGFGCGRIDGMFGPKTKAALAEFQRKHDLADTGEADSVTRQKLREVHDWH